MKRLQALAVCALLALASGCATGSTSTTAPTAGSRQDTASTSLPPSPPGTNPPGTPAELVEVFDGDSLLAAIDGITVEVRLIGINAPERDECHADASRRQLAELLDSSSLVLESSDDDDDQFGRLLRYAWVDGIEVNARMLTVGGAIALQTGHERQDDYVSLAREASQQRRGMWATDACGPGRVLPIDIQPIEYNPAGVDAENAINEWIDITNVGSETLDMTGWTLRDESSTHRYVFGNVQLDPNATVRVRSGCGEDRDLDLVWCATDPVWNNGGDTAILQDAEGNIVAFRSYEDGFPTARFLDD